MLRLCECCAVSNWCRSDGGAGLGGPASAYAVAKLRNEAGGEAQGDDVVTPLLEAFPYLLVGRRVVSPCS